MAVPDREEGCCGYCGNDDQADQRDPQVELVGDEANSPGGDDTAAVPCDGQHRNPTRHPGYFAASYFHLPEELGAEMREAGLAHERTFPIQGPACMLQDVEERWQDDVKREAILRAVRWLESEPSLIGASSHLLAVGRKAE